MKKIVFVEKDESSTYDPVSTFFAKKKQTKPPSASKNTGSKPMPNRTSITKPTVAEKKQIEKEKAVTGKIGRKGDYNIPKRKAPDLIVKQETIYTQSSKKLNNNNPSKGKIQIKHTQDIEHQRSIREQNNKQEKNIIKLQPIDKKQTSQEINNLKRKIKQLEANEQQYQTRLTDLEGKEEKFYKNQQKLTKIQKQHKMCGQDVKQLTLKLKQKEEQLKKLYAKDDIPYNKKRQILLTNQMNQLKKTNRELVSRIKNYRGNDLVEISIQNNKSDIMNEFQSKETEQQKPDLSHLESLSFRLIQLIENFITTKTGGKQYAWVEEKKLLSNLSALGKEISLLCLQHQLKIPTSNEQAVNLYDEIDKYQTKLQPLLSKHDLNLVITEENIQLINRMHEEIGQMHQNRNLQISIWNEGAKKFKKANQASSYYLNKMKEIINIYERRYQVQDIMLAHCFAQMSYIRSWVNKMTGSLKQSLINVSCSLKEMQEIASLGQSGKQSLFLYVCENGEDLLLKIPNIELRMKEIGQIFKKKIK